MDTVSRRPTTAREELVECVQLTCRSVVRYRRRAQICYAFWHSRGAAWCCCLLMEEPYGTAQRVEDLSSGGKPPRYDPAQTRHGSAASVRVRGSTSKKIIRCCPYHRVANLLSGDDVSVSLSSDALSSKAGLQGCPQGLTLGPFESDRVGRPCPAYRLARVEGHRQIEPQI